MIRWRLWPFSDRIAVMDKGKIVQIGAPEEIYNKPVNTFVASFIGATNLINGQVVSEPAGQNSIGVVEFPGQNEAVQIKCIFSKEIIKNRKVALSLRQERIKMWSVPPDKIENLFIGKVNHRSFLGDCFSYHVQVGDHNFRVKADPQINAEIGADVSLSIRPEDVIVLPFE